MILFLIVRFQLYQKQDSEETVGELIPTLKIDLLSLKTCLPSFPMIIKYVLFETSEIQMILQNHLSSHHSDLMLDNGLVRLP